MKTLLLTAVAAVALTAASTAFASPNRGTELARHLHNVVHVSPRAYALTGETREVRKATPAPKRHPVYDQLSRGRGAF